MTSPARRQYLELKRQHPDAILLYRLGDFYEMFDEDAKVASRTLGIQLTARTYPRGEGRVPMAGVPHHSVDSYIKRLLDAGHRVALCEQLTEPGSGLVDRDVVRIFTPGTLVEPDMLSAGENNYLAALAVDRTALGLAHVDVTTGEFAVTEVDGPYARSQLEAELFRIAPVECVMAGHGIEINLPPGTTVARDVANEPAGEGEERLLRHLKAASAAAFGLEAKPAAKAAAAAILAYLGRTNSRALDLVDDLRFYSIESHMSLDPFTRSSLELLPAPGQRASAWTLLRVLDRTCTAPGARRLRAVIGRPLINAEEIRSRLDMVEALVERPITVRRLKEALSRVGDVERIMGRICQGRAGVADLDHLRRSLVQTSRVTEAVQEVAELEALCSRLDPCEPIAGLIAGAVDADSGEVIKRGHDPELDELRDTVNQARESIAQLERTEAESTGLKGLRISYNKVFGYYIEVARASSHAVPDRYVRQQTLISSERYFTPELKALEAQLLAARDSVETLEKQAVEAVLTAVRSGQEQIMQTAAALAELDVVRGLAEVALECGYVRPVIDDSGALHVRQGRHPIVEASRTEVPFVPNDCDLDESQRIIILTGPNMGGKSTMLRMVTIIVLMAQIGSFVPAEEAVIGVVDRIFSRVGARDDIAAGQSTFMTEMIETSNILRHATANSLLILDEIGRGTSTYDGLAIARSVIEYIHARIGARTLFATHYHELTAIADELEGVANFHTAVAADDASPDQKVTFLHKIVPGAADRSYGIHVARLAGLPHSVTVRADRLLRQLERPSNGRRAAATAQLALFTDPDLAPKSEAETVAIRVMDELLALDLQNMTPLDALQRLHRFQEESRGSG